MKDSKRFLWLSCLLLFVFSLLPRVAFLGHTFESSDTAELAVRILKNSGYAWMLSEKYGLLINLVTKWGTALVSTFHISLTEFYWKLPVAVVASSQAVMAFLFLRYCLVSTAVAFAAGLFFAVLPIHVMQSRYLWGYEVLGLLFLLPSIMALNEYFRIPSFKSSLRASLFSGLYLISHGFIHPFVAVLLFFVCTTDTRIATLRTMCDRGVLMLKHGLWIFPALMAPLIWPGIRHGLNKQTSLGFYLPDHFLGFVGNIGWPLFGLLIVVFAGALAIRPKASPETPPRLNHWLLWFCGLAYLLPLIVGAQPGLTVIRGYFLLGNSLCSLQPWSGIGFSHFSHLA